MDARHDETSGTATVLAVGLVVALGLGISACGTSESAEVASPGATGAAKPIAVSVTTVLGRDEPITVDATGSFAAAETSEVAPQTAGLVMATPVDVGQFVTAGAPLVRLQGTDAALRLDEARAAVRRADANVQLVESQNALAESVERRNQALLERGLIARSVADEARTAAETARQTVNTARASQAESKAQLALAQKAVRDVVIVAPFAGYVAERHVSAGEYVQPTSPVVRLLKIDPLRLQLVLPAIQSGQVRVGQLVEATVDAFPGRCFEGEVSAVNPAITPESRSLTIEARVPNSDAALKPGMFAVARIDLGRTTRALFVPRQAVVEDPNTNSFRVFVVDDHERARLRVVQMAARQDGNLRRIDDGIVEGDRVATSNLADLFDSAAVTIVPGADRDNASTTP